VTSDVPLVEVGLPGQRGSARRYVGVANIAAGSAPDRRIDVRVRAEKGDVHLRLPVAVAASTPSRPETPRIAGTPGTPTAARSREKQVGDGQQQIGRTEAVHAVLDALERREISVAQAEALLSALGS
jgi:hypothetical protein